MRRPMLRVLFACFIVLACAPSPARAQVAVQAYALPSGGGFPHDVAVGSDGIVWYTAQRDGKLGRLDPATGKVELISLGAGAAPHGVIVGPDGAPWVTEGGHNAIVRVDPKTREVKSWSLPASRGYANLNTAAFDNRGRIWFTGQSGIYGRLDPKTGAMQVWDAPRGLRALRHRGHARWRGLLRFARRKPHRAPRPRDRGRHGHRAADQEPGRAARVVGLERRDLGQRMEQRQRQPLRSRARTPGRPGDSPARSRAPMPSTWTIGTWCG